MVTEVTSGVKITVNTYYEEQFSNPTRGTHFFIYFVNIENLNPFPVQLLHRHWEIIDPNEQKREVLGEGVVGKQPTIFPGDFFRYNSGCDFKSTFGKMRGSYTMLNLETNKEFTVQIPEFITEVPYFLN